MRLATPPHQFFDTCYCPSRQHALYDSLAGANNSLLGRCTHATIRVFNRLHVLPELTEIICLDSLTECDEALILQYGTHRVGLLTLIADTVQRWLDALGRSPFTTLFMHIQTICKPLTAMPETTRLRLVHLRGIEVLSNRNERSAFLRA